MQRGLLRIIGWTSAAVAFGAAAYATYVANAWLTYGRADAPSRDEMDRWLDQFMPDYEVTERHHVRVNASPAVTLSAAANVDLQDSPVVRGIIKLRELVLGAEADTRNRPLGLLAEMQSIGWRVLAEQPGREIVVGAVTQPWMANVKFRGLAPEAFRDFRDPDYVKIVWTLRADPDGSGGSIFRTETRVATTDATARRKFRWYWARFSPGIILIRWALLRQFKTEAERRFVQVAPRTAGPT